MAEKRTYTYEGMILLSQAQAADFAGAIAHIRQLIERYGGQIIAMRKWDERRLAYEIKKQKRGVYILCYFACPSDQMAQIERGFNLSENVLRVLITRADHLNEQEMNAVEPQPIQPREERNPWDRPDFNRPPRRDDRPRDDRPRDDRPREDRPPRREEEAGAAKD